MGVSFFISTQAFGQLPSYLPTNGLVGWWPFNGNANDESGNGNNGTVNGTNYVNDRNGINNSALFQNNNNSYVKTQSKISNSANNFTISFWAFPNQIDLVKNQGTTGNEGYGTMPIIHPAHGSNWGSQSMNAGVGINVGTNQIQVVEHTHLFIGSPLVYSTQITGWNHFVLVYEQHQPKLYMNGSLVAFGLVSSIQNVHPSSGFCSVYAQSGFGRSFSPNGTPVGNYNGSFDDIAIWNRVLTPQEIINLYNGYNVGIEEENEVDGLKIFPNPANNHITIDNGNFSAMAGYSIKITNNAGQQVFQSAINQQQFYVDLSTWSGNGLYFVHLIDPQNNTVTIRKIVLQ